MLGRSSELVRNTLLTKSIRLPGNLTNSLLVKISFLNSPLIHLATTNNPPHTDLDVAVLQHLSTSYPRLILAVDLNARDRKFNNRGTCNNGCLLYSITLTTDLRHHNKPATLIPCTISSRPDNLLTTADLSHRIHGIRLGADVGSDHIPLLFTVAHGHVIYLGLEPRLSTARLPCR